MRKTAWLVLLVVAVVSLLAPRPVNAAVGVTVSVSSFYDELSPYGRWAEVGRYGHCWIPEHVAVGWQPYTDGEWVYTDYGWTWVSYDPWGGDPYHYGTWAWEDPFGWAWVPGTVWAPAWVTWSYGDSYVGWAPIPPSLEISYSGYSGPAVVVAQAQYVFVPVNRFAGVRITTARLPVQQNSTLLQQTQRMTSFSVSKGIVVNRGPSVQRIESAAHTKIPRASIDAAKTRPTPMSAAGARKGGRMSVVTPASVRASELKGKIVTRAGETPEKGARAPSSGETRHEAKPKAKSAKPEHGGGRQTAPQSASERNAGVKKGREAVPLKHEAAPPPRHEAAPPKHETAPPKHETAPPKHETAPPRHEAPPPRHESAPPPPSHAASAPSRQAPPPRRETPPPPPPHAEARPSAHSESAKPVPAPSKPKQQPAKKDEENPHRA